MNILNKLLNEIEEKELNTANNIIYAPSSNKCKSNTIKVFLAGTIDDGKSDNWQKQICKKFINNDNFSILNPRRDKWDASLGSKEVIRQIKWEHKRMDEADFIIMNILPKSKSPISLMEIGMYCQSKKLIVFCTDNFYRWENVKCVCDKYGIKLFETNKTEDIVEQILKLNK